MKEKLTLSEQPEKEKRLGEIRDRIEGITDALGKKIDPGIKEAVVMLSAFDLRTEQSCEGHFGKKRGLPFPWVDIGPEKPKKEKWYEDEELRKKVTREKLEMQAKVIDLLSEFYGERKVPFDAMLSTKEKAYSFRLQSIGSSVMKTLPEEKAENKAAQYESEMDDFTEFLKNKFLLE